MKTRLFIENQEVELDKSVQFAITKQFEDITNPSTIINDWSKTVSIPETKSNNKLFGFIFRVDRRTVIGEVHENIGNEFDAYKKANFRLEYNDSVIMEGYLKLNQINRKDGKNYYNVTLYGSLGNILSELKKITLNPQNGGEGGKYLVYPDKSISTISRDLVRQCWESGMTVDTNEIIGFTPNTSYNSDFDYNTYLQKYEFLNYTDVLENRVYNGKTLKDVTGANPSDIIPNGMTQLGIGEFRSYYQIPFYRWKYLFTSVMDKLKNITGYNYTLNSSWFNKYNPYWEDLVITGEPLYNKEGQSFINTYKSTLYTNEGTTLLHAWAGGEDDYYSERTAAYKITEVVQEVREIYAGNNMFLSPTIPSLFKFGVDIKIQKTSQEGWNANTCLGFRYELYEGADLISSSGIGFVTSNTTITLDYIKNWSLFRNCNVIELKTFGQPNTVSSDMSEIVYAQYFPEEREFSPFRQLSIKVYYAWVSRPVGYLSATGTIAVFANPSVTTVGGSTSKRSFSKFTLNDLWNNDFNIYDYIVNYIKQFRLGLYIDDFKKNITIKPLYTDVDISNIKDWTDKVDMSKDFIIKPITLEKKYVLFDSKDSPTYLGERYLDKYGVNYGSKKITTNYNFNEEEESILDVGTPPTLYSPNVLSWNYLYNPRELFTYVLTKNSFVDCSDKDGNYVSPFGRFYFYKGLTEFDRDLELREVKLSDDNSQMAAYNLYCYTNNSYDATVVSTYQELGINKDTNWCTWTIPIELYTRTKTIPKDSRGIYENFWEDYINERYDVQNKIVTCYIKLNVRDFQNIKDNPFVTIDNQLYFVNKIEDFNFESNDATKVELVTVRNIEGYTTNKFFKED